MVQCPPCAAKGGVRYRPTGANEMRIESVKLVFFSPTGTTKTVARAIVQGICPDATETIDITSPAARKQPLRISKNELLVIAVPVYMGRVPELLGEWLNSIQAHGTPAVCVVVYGNRAYEDALLELTEVVGKCGGIPIAGAAYIGEHSFSTPENPVAQGRPDKEDLAHAAAFGTKIRDKIQAMTPASKTPDVPMPGVFPYRGSTTLWDVDFIEVSNLCTQCGVCAEVCPTGAVAPENSVLIDREKCITCCACIKSCPQRARTMKHSPVMEASKRLHTLYGERKEPECFV